MIISNPAGALSSINSSNFLITHALNGPMIIAPRNIGISAPMINPIVPIVPATPPRSPPTNLPPMKEINIGNKI